MVDYKFILTIISLMLFYTTSTYSKGKFEGRVEFKTNSSIKKLEDEIREICALGPKVEKPREKCKPHHHPEIKERLNKQVQLFAEKRKSFWKVIPPALRNAFFKECKRFTNIIEYTNCPYKILNNAYTLPDARIIFDQELKKLKIEGFGDDQIELALTKFKG